MTHREVLAVLLLQCVTVCQQPYVLPTSTPCLVTYGPCPFQTGSPSATPTDVPRLPLSVNDLASRYQPGDGPSSPRPGASSPPPPRQLPLIPSTSSTPPRQSNSYQERTLHNPEPSPSTTGANLVKDDEASQWQRQKADELAGLELRQKQAELQEREREIEMRARELEMDRLRLVTAREENGLANTNTNEDSRRKPEHQFQPIRPMLPRSQLDPGQASVNASSNLAPLSPLRPRFSQSSSPLTPPSPSRKSPQLPTSPDLRSAYLHSNSSSHQSSQQHEDMLPHAPSCGCETCSAAKYRTPSPTKPLSIRPVEKSKPGWIRRLSVPVGNAFNLDSKKSTGNPGGLGSGKNGSTSSFGTTILHDDRSYEASVNRSITNLGGRQ